MGTRLSGNSEILSEAQGLVREWAGPRPYDETVAIAIRRAARRLGFSVSRVKAIWYGEAAAIRAEEMDALRKREKAADEIAILRKRIERLEAHLLLVAQDVVRGPHSPLRDPVGSRR